MARDFNGTADYLELGSAPVTAMPLSMACWFNADNQTTSTVPLSICTGGGVGRFQLTVAGAVAGDPLQATAFGDAGGNNSAVTSTGYTAGVWTHGLAIFTSQTSRRIYINGGSSAQATTSITAPAAVDRVVVGARYSTIVGALFPGLIAEAAIWNIAFTGAEASLLAAGVSPMHVRPDALVFYAPLHRDLINFKGAPLTDGGATVVVDHPRIFHFLRPQISNKITSSNQTLTPALFTNSATFFSPTVTPGAVALTPSLVTNSQTFHAPTVAATYALTAPLLTNSTSFHSPTVAAGTVDLTPNLLSSNSSFYAPTVASGAVALAPALTTNLSAFYTATVAPGAAEILPGLLSNSATFFAATVTQDSGDQSLAPNLFSNTSVFYAPIVASSAEIAAPLVVNTSVFHAPTISSNYILTAPLIPSAAVFFAATIEPGAVNIAPALFANDNIFFAPTVSAASDQDLLAETFVNQNVIYPPVATWTRKDRATVSRPASALSLARPGQTAASRPPAISKGRR